jgi:TRAP-type C4-dicarboxylate transport system permease small subunit
MTHDTSLKIIVAVYFFTLSFIVYYGIDIVIQYFFHDNINWTKYISSAFSHAIMTAAGAVFGWETCKDWHKGDH